MLRSSADSMWTINGHGSSLAAPCALAWIDVLSMQIARAVWNTGAMTELTIAPEQVARTPLTDTEELPEWAASLLHLVADAARAGETVEVHTRLQTLTPSEVATRLGLSTSTVSRRIKAGDIRTIKVGNRHRIPMTEYEAFRRRLMSQVVEHYADDLEADLVG